MKQDIIHVQVSTFDNGSEVREHHLMLSVSAEGAMLSYAEQLEALCTRFTIEQQKLTAKTVFKRYFLSDAANQTLDLKKYESSQPEYVLSIVEQAPANGTKVALWCILMTGVETKNNPSGLFEVSYGGYRHLYSASNYNLAQGSEEQTRQLFEHYISQLSQEGCTLADNCIRTWFFVNDIDNNYAGVVNARNDVFKTQNLTENTHFIASTGIGGRQANPLVLSQLDTYAVAGIKQEQIKYLYAADKMNRTSEYGVSFERATAVDYADRRQVFVSGTASINNKGDIVHVGDIRKQCLCMWENVEALLAEADSDWTDVSEIVCYLRDFADFIVVDRMFNEKFSNVGTNKKSIPYLLVHAPVCRPGWLIEMECMATKRL
jgi:enamine deaminase RidA (YjgF/YER057c/UK114 family)